MAVDIDAIPTHLVEVTATTRLGRYQRITLRGSDLVGVPELGPDDFAYLLLPPPGRTELTIDRGFRWADVPRMPPEDRPVGAYYTVVERRDDLGEWDIDVLLHPHPGPASTWAADAVVASPAALWGPRTAWDPPDEVDRWVLVADESGLPALVRILRLLGGSSCRVLALVEADDPASLPDLPASPGIDVQVSERDAGSGRELSATAAREASSGHPYVWAGIEAGVVATLRDALGAIALPNERCSLTAYWRSRDPAHRSPR